MIHTIIKAMAILAVTGSMALGQTPTSATELTDAQKEEFLLDAEVIRGRNIGVGVNRTRRLTLRYGGTEHDAHFSDVDIFERVYRLPNRTELNFTDNYKYNIAAFRLDRMIGLNMLPVTVERTVNRAKGSLAWWLDIIMMERERYEKNLQVPDPECWNEQMYQVRVFNELVYNTDANLGNLLITPEWDIRLVDFTRAFRTSKTLLAPENLELVHGMKVRRHIYEGLKGLTEEQLLERMDGYLTKPQIRALLARRDKIIEFLDGQIAEKGEADVICDEPGR